MALTDHEMVDIHYNKMSSLQVNISAARLTRNNNNDDRNVKIPRFRRMSSTPCFSIFVPVFPFSIFNNV